jgi:hypothetical protein
MASTMTMTLECTRIRAEVSPVALMITALSDELQLSLRKERTGRMSKAAKGMHGQECDVGRLVNCNLSRYSQYMVPRWN